MTPDFRIFADERDVTERIARRLLELSITDEAGFSSDALTLTVDDADGLLSVPRKGATLAVYLGYKEVGLAHMGEFIVDEPELSGPPDKIVIRARGADLRGHLKASKTRSWSNVTIDEIVRVIASEHDLQAKVAEQFSGIVIAHIDQCGESDLHFLTRLAKEYDAVSKPAGVNLLFAHRGLSEAVSGEALPSITLARSDVTTYRLVLSDRSDIGCVTAYWQDKGKARRTGETVGDRTLPGKTLRSTYPSAAEARSAATSELSALQRARKNLDITLPGNPRIGAESPITLSGGWREGFEGEYVAVRVEHRLSANGYTTSFSAN